ncbi:MAG: hypothetical protein A2527_05425 [Candidatus Lambdaproteobacteria bacterium RIFOXYD2_FULL_50_16]|uniref:Uncharacterized protein n=1 Tax=Candidatus Lambdaproteobacteria bacterium RIFOXYD2_FULL_50_16 TaxID=1817772 RepID=A0A1F6G932_9PROT|nr:MAG: hypothetical protein A2527_05425 [Candidatus Lambdaproteobacteria bacterium RIFOXYD2_FULL_50_16]
MDFDRHLVRSNIEAVLAFLIEKIQEIEGRGLLEYYQELFVDLKNLIEPICEYGSAKHLMMVLPDRLLDIEKELGCPLPISEELKKLIHYP